MNTLREAAQAVVDQWDTPNWKLVVHTGVLIDRLRAALAEPETTAEPVAWLNRHHAAMVTQDHATAVAMGFTTPLYAHPPRDEWRPASDPPENGRDVVVWCAQERRAVHGMYVRRHPPVVGLVDGWVAPDASELTHWRDVTPPGQEGKG